MDPHTLTEIVSFKNFIDDPLICVPVAPGEYPVFQAVELQPGFDDPDRQLFAEPKAPLGTRRHLKMFLRQMYTLLVPHLALLYVLSSPPLLNLEVQIIM